MTNNRLIVVLTLLVGLTSTACARRDPQPQVVPQPAQPKPTKQPTGPSYDEPGLPASGADNDQPGLEPSNDVGLDNGGQPGSGGLERDKPIEPTDTAAADGAVNGADNEPTVPNDEPGSDSSTDRDDPVQGADVSKVGVTFRDGTVLKWTGAADGTDSGWKITK